MPSIDYWERFAEEHPELEHNVNIGVARPSIDHGRLLTLERRRKLATLEATLHLTTMGWVVHLENHELLSPRRIYRRTNTGARVPADIADAIHGLIKAWVDAGYPSDLTRFRTSLIPRWAWDVQLVKKGA